VTGTRGVGVIGCFTPGDSGGGYWGKFLGFTSTKGLKWKEGLSMVA